MFSRRAVELCPSRYHRETLNRVTVVPLLTNCKAYSVISYRVYVTRAELLSYFRSISKSPRERPRAYEEHGLPLRLVRGMRRLAVINNNARNSLPNRATSINVQPAFFLITTQGNYTEVESQGKGGMVDPLTKSSLRSFN